MGSQINFNRGEAGASPGANRRVFGVALAMLAAAAFLSVGSVAWIANSPVIAALSFLALGACILLATARVRVVLE